MRTTIEKLLRSGRYDRSAVKILLYPLLLLSVVYGVIVRVRAYLYGKSLLQSRRLPCKVISVGNITVGGTGKTPMTLYIGRLLTDRGFKTAVLSRGYGGSNEGTTRILSSGGGPLYGPYDSGDEPYLIATKLKDTPVLIGRNRYKSGLLAYEKFNVDIIVLDDGYQHLSLKRDLNILLVSPETLKGNGYLLPRGELREPFQSVSRADLILVKGDKNDQLHFMKRLNMLNNSAPLFFFKYNPVSLTNVGSSEVVGLEFLREKKLLAFCGIALPESFFKTLEELGGNVHRKLTFPDHHTYSINDLNKLKAASAGVDVIVTTEKDGVKLKEIIPPELELFILDIDVSITELERFKDYLLKLFCNDENPERVDGDKMATTH
jgi:tetraacyldisaccharide 4'-kinase